MKIQPTHPCHTADRATSNTHSDGFTVAYLWWHDGSYVELYEEAKELGVAELRRLGSMLMH